MLDWRGKDRREGEREGEGGGRKGEGRTETDGEGRSTEAEKAWERKSGVEKNRCKDTNIY